MAPERVKVPLTFKPGSARIVSQPLGVVLVIAPWNYPVQLTSAPLVAALAAGNAAVLKPSELAPATSAALADLVPAYLDEPRRRRRRGRGRPRRRRCWPSASTTSSTPAAATVGRIVMRAAAEHLTPVTLELGGKSPAIVAADADVDVAAHRIAWGRFINAGQTCVAPDYVLVHRDVEDQFLGGVLRAVHDFYGDDPRSSPDYGRIVDERHFDRLDRADRRRRLRGRRRRRRRRPRRRGTSRRPCSPACKPDAAVMQEEIFGPILPVLAVADVDEAVAVRQRAAGAAGAVRVHERRRGGRAGRSSARRRAA